MVEIVGTAPIACKLQKRDVWAISNLDARTKAFLCRRASGSVAVATPKFVRALFSSAALEPPMPDPL